MPISRRGFLGYAAGVSAIGLGGKAHLEYFFGRDPRELSGCVLVDKESSCTLRESLEGYESALTSAHVAFKRNSLQSLPPSRIVILPAFVFAQECEPALIKQHIENGATIILESGAAFIRAEEFDFHRQLIDSEFGLSLHAPIGLWESADSFSQPPYIDYRWPAVMKVRDFSRAIPVECRKGETIAWFHELPVAIKRRVGQGRLIFLGSPLGPHLRVRDREAIRWLQAVCSSC